VASISIIGEFSFHKREQQGDEPSLRTAALSIVMGRYPLAPQQCLNFFPLPQGQGWLRPGAPGVDLLTGAPPFFACPFRSSPCKPAFIVSVFMALRRSGTFSMRL
jgi:hypothetical protein